jgi:hypothetical protein
MPIDPEAAPSHEDTLTEVTGGKLWKLFWSLYFVFAWQRPIFRQNYTAAWKRSLSGLTITILLDGQNRVEVPVWNFSDDESLIRHLGTFYMLLKVERGFMSVFLPSEATKIEIIDVRRLQPLISRSLRTCSFC